MEILSNRPRSQKSCVCALMGYCSSRLWAADVGIGFQDRWTFHSIEFDIGKYFILISQMSLPRFRLVVFTTSNVQSLMERFVGDLFQKMEFPVACEQPTYCSTSVCFYCNLYHSSFQRRASAQRKTKTSHWGRKGSKVNVLDVACVYTTC